MTIQPILVRFGSVRYHFSKNGSSSVRFDCVFKKVVRVRFGSIRTEPNRFSSVRVRFVFGLCTLHKTYKCLSNNMNGGRRNEWEIKLKSVIYSDRVSNTVQNTLVISFSSCIFTVEKCSFLITCREKMTFFRNKFLITQRRYELMSWNCVQQWGTQRSSTYKKIVWIGRGKRKLLAKYC